MHIDLVETAIQHTDLIADVAGVRGKVLSRYCAVRRDNRTGRLLPEGLGVGPLVLNPNLIRATHVSGESGLCIGFVS